MLRFRSPRRWCSRQASDRDRPSAKKATLRISLNPVRSSIVQDLRILPIDSSLVYLAVSEYIFLSLCFLADMCVFQVMSINKSMSSNKKLLSFVKLVKLSVSCFQKCYLSKKFWGSASNPTGGSDPHLQSTSIYLWLRPWFYLGILRALLKMSKSSIFTQTCALLLGGHNLHCFPLCWHLIKHFQRKSSSRFALVFISSKVLTWPRENLVADFQSAFTKKM